MLVAIVDQVGVVRLNVAWRKYPWPTVPFPVTVITGSPAGEIDVIIGGTGWLTCGAPTTSVALTVIELKLPPSRPVIVNG